MLTPDFFSRKLNELTQGKANSRYLLAVSGGVDSMVLLWLFCNLKFDVQNLTLSEEVSNLKPQISNFEVAHINYKLRGEDSDLDQKLVEKFCKKHGVKLHIYKVSEQDNCPQNGSIQLWARELRYRFFEKIKDEEEIDFLVMAHHLNDQLETFFINLFRGSGLAGLTGIPENDNEILRPLLSISKEEIYAFAQKNKIPFREDISNQKNDYQRNKIRNNIVPKLEEIKPDFLSQFGKSIGILSDVKDFVKQQIDQIIKDSTLKKDDKIWVLNKKKLAQRSDFEQFEILRRFGFDSEKENAKMFKAVTGRKFKSDTFEVLINRNEMIFIGQQSEEDTEEESVILEKISDNEFQVKGCEWATTKPQKWLFDKSRLKLPLKIRKRKEGDTIYQVGMLGKKKVSKLLKDEKMSQLNKEKTRILCDADDNILGVLPLRQDRILSVEKGQKDVIIVCF